MLSITAHNVNDAYHEGLWRVKILGVEADSRNGKVKRIPGPVATTYKKPEQRMLLDPRRDANPFFHIFEGIWMLAGSRDVAWISQFNSHIHTFSDDGKHFHGAYGYRWRNHWGEDQLIWVIEHLRKEPESRRAVLQMFDPAVDQPSRGPEMKDIPCNTAIYFDIVEGVLNMTVTCRSNDMIWGAYGANAVHMSMLQEFIARALGIRVGQYVQFSNNFHVYERHFPLLDYAPDPTSYTRHMVEGHEPLTSQTYWGGDLIQFEQWMDAPSWIYDAQYIVRVLQPMLQVWQAYRNLDKDAAMRGTGLIQDVAVKTACLKWLQRRK